MNPFGFELVVLGGAAIHVAVALPFIEHAFPNLHHRVSSNGLVFVVYLAGLFVIACILTIGEGWVLDRLLRGVNERRRARRERSEKANENASEQGRWGG